MKSEPVYKPFPSETKVGLWVVAKRCFAGTSEEKYVPIESVHYQNEADTLNQEAEENETLKEKGGIQ